MGGQLGSPPNFIQFSALCPQGTVSLTILLSLSLSAFPCFIFPVFFILNFLPEQVF